MDKLFADFNNTDNLRRVRLNCSGTAMDLKKHKIELFEGKEILLTDDDELEAIGIIQFSAEENMWVAVIKWECFFNKSK